MTITLDGTTGITAPAITTEGGLTLDGVTFADNTPANTLVTTSSGNVGIGASSPSRKLEVSSNDAQTDLMVSRTSNGLGTILRWDNTGGYSYLYNNGAYPLLFGTNNTERARIDSSGNLLVGTTSNNATGKLAIAGNNGVTGSAIAITNQSGTSQYYAAAFYNNGNSVSYCGSIAISGTTTQYATSSDYRLKENIAPLTGALATVAQLKPCSYSWKGSGESTQGFIAHELQEVLPDAVVGEKDAVNEDGSIKPQGIDTSFLVATLTAAIQEQQAMIAEQSTLITQLRADVEALKGQA